MVYRGSPSQQDFADTDSLGWPVKIFRGIDHAIWTLSKVASHSLALLLRPQPTAPQVGTLAAIWLAMLTAESAGLALHVLTSIRTLFRCASARPQAHPGALAFC